MPTRDAYNARKFAVRDYTGAWRTELEMGAYLCSSQRCCDQHRNARRALIGGDARRVDFISRLMGSAYQIHVLRFHRKMQGRRANNPHAARPSQTAASTHKDIA